MPLSSNTLRVQVDTPIWEWCRPNPNAVVTSSLSCSCTPDNSNFHRTSGRYIYYYLTVAGGFWRYDTWSDTYQQLASPMNAPVTRNSMKYSGASGFFGRVISATSTTLTTGIPFGAAAKTFKIRIISGTGAGQERYISDVADPVVADFGVATSGAVLTTTATLIDTTKTWTSGYTGTALNFNNWVGYVVRTVLGTGVNQIRKILYNNATTLFIGDISKHPDEAWCHVTWTAPAAGTNYQIESSVITVDFPWTTIPDNTSRYVIQSGGIYMLSGSATTPFITLQYYDILSDVWYVQPLNTNMVAAAPTDLTLERTTENASIWWHGIADGTHSTTTLQDSAVNWTVDEWAGYYAFIYSGTGCEQILRITSNTATTLTFPALATEARTCNTGANGSTTITLTVAASDHINGWKISGTNVAAGAYVVSGQGTTTLVVSAANTGVVDGNALVLTFQPDDTSRYQIMGFDAGTASSATYNTLVDSAKTGSLAWTTNRWVNYAVRILAGTGAGQLRSILSNTDTTLTLYNSWNVIPDSTSVYAIQGDSSNFYFVLGGYSEVFIYRTANDVNTLSHGRVLDTGVASIMCAMLCDANHIIAEQPPIAISGITRSTTTATATTVNPHNLKVGQYVSIRGNTTTADVQYYNGLQTITGVPSVTTFTYTMTGTPSGSAAGLTANTTSLISDASKDHRQVASGGVDTELTITFAANTPSNILGYYVNGTNIGAGARVVSGSGTTTLTLSVANSGTVSGVIIFTAWGPSTAVTALASSGTTLTANLVLQSALPAYCAGWYVSGTSIGLGAIVGSGAGTNTLVLTKKHTGAVSNGTTITFSPPRGGDISMVYGNSTTVTVTTGASTVGQAMQVTNSNGSNFQVVAAMANALTPGVSRYVIAKRDCLGAASEGGDIAYTSGLTTTGAAGTSTDVNAFYTDASCSGVAQTTTITLSVASPTNINGWYLLAGTGINVGTRVVSGAGTTSLTMSIANSGTVSGSLTFCAWNTSALVNKRIKYLSGVAGADSPITAVAGATGVITAAGTSVSNASSYSVISATARGVGIDMGWTFGLSDLTKRGKYLIIPRGGAVAGFDRLDLTTDKFINLQTTPVSEALGQSSMYVYDGYDRYYFTKDVTNRVYYLNLLTYWIHGAGTFPYIVGTTILGNRFEIIETADRLKYLWVNRHASVECFKQLLFY